MQLLVQYFINSDGLYRQGGENDFPEGGITFMVVWEPQQLEVFSMASINSVRFIFLTTMLTFLGYCKNFVSIVVGLSCSPCTEVNKIGFGLNIQIPYIMSELKLNFNAYIAKL